MNPGKSFYLFTWKDIVFRMHWSLILVFVYYVFRDPNHFKSNLAIQVIFLITVLVHELGHIFAARAVGAKAKEIVLWPLGGLAYTTDHGDLKNSLKITLGGPVTHIPMCALFCGLYASMEGSFHWSLVSPMWDQFPPVNNFWSIIWVVAAKIQVTLFLLNLFVPAYPLDGGHVVVESLLLRGWKAEKVAKVIIGLSVFSAVLLVAVFKAYILGIFLAYSTWQLYQLLSQGQLRMHPLFHLAMGKSRGGGHLRVVKRKKPAGRTCPYCQLRLNPGAKMCGFCERILPEE